MSDHKTFDAWWLEFTTEKRAFFDQLTALNANAYKDLARISWMTAQTAALALSGSRVVYVLDYIGSDDIPRRMIYATRAAADRALQRSNKRAMITVETVRTF